MAQVAALPDHLPHTLDKPVFTFIVPAPNGCNLNCPYCFITRRREISTGPKLTPPDYLTFIEQAAASEEIGAQIA